MDLCLFWRSGCEIEWEAVGAIGTLATGAGAAFIAWKANDLARRIARRDKRRSKTSARAYAIAALHEIESLRLRVEAILPYATNANQFNDAQHVGALAAAVRAFPPLLPSQQISQSPAIGDLPKSLGLAIAEFTAKTSEMGLFIQTIFGLSDRILLAPDGNSIFDSVVEKLTELVPKARSCEQSLKQYVGLSPDDPAL